MQSFGRRRKKRLTHSDESLPSVKSVDHSYFSVGSATSDDERKKRKSVELIIGKFVELSGGHDHGILRFL